MYIIFIPAYDSEKTREWIRWEKKIPRGWLAYYAEPSPADLIVFLSASAHHVSEVSQS